MDAVLWSVVVATALLIIVVPVVVTQVSDGDGDSRTRHRAPPPSAGVYEMVAFEAPPPDALVATNKVHVRGETFRVSRGLKARVPGLVAAAGYLDRAVAGCSLGRTYWYEGGECVRVMSPPRGAGPVTDVLADPEMRHVFVVHRYMVVHNGTPLYQSEVTFTARGPFVQDGAFYVQPDGLEWIKYLPRSMIRAK